MPRASTLGAIRQHPILAVFPVLVLVMVALALGLTRPPKYTAESKLAIGRIDVSAPGALAGFSQATEALASTYSRAIDATAVLTPVAQRLMTTPGALRTQLSATPVPESPVFVIRAVSESDDAAVSLANAAADSLIQYVRDLNRSNPDSDRLYRNFRDVSLRVSSLKGRVKKLAAEAATDKDREELEELKAVVQADSLRLDAIKSNYIASLEGQGNTVLVQVLTGATFASDDQLSRLQIYVFLGLVAGVLTGAALATLRANRLIRRRVINGPE